MSAPGRTMSDSSHHSDTLRKRVTKACDRCRLKKSKCNGDTPCSRCIADNAICVFGERKRAHDKIYPKGYVEMLEQQQAQLVAGLQETYRRLRAANLWPGKALDEREGHPLTHDILNTLEIIHHKADDHADLFEEDTEKLQHRLLAHGAPFIHRRGSFSSDSDQSTTHSHAPSHSHSHKRARSHIDSPLQSPKLASSRKSFDQDRSIRSTTVSHSVSQTQSHNPHRPSPLHTDSVDLDQLQVVEEDALMSSFDWQELPPDTISSSDPQFTFPIASSTGYGSMLDQWSDMSNPNYASLFAQPMQPTLDYTNMQQLQKDPLNVDLNGYVPAIAS